MTILVELLATTPIVPPIPEPEYPGLWSPPWYSRVFLTITILGILSFTTIVLSPERWFQNGLSPVTAMGVSLAAIFLGGIAIAAGNAYSQHVNDEAIDEYWVKYFERYDQVYESLNEAHGVTLITESPDIDTRTIIPTERGPERDALVERPDGSVDVCDFTFTPQTYILTCPTPETHQQ